MGPCTHHLTCPECSRSQQRARIRNVAIDIKREELAAALARAEAAERERDALQRRLDVKPDPAGLDGALWERDEARAAERMATEHLLLSERSRKALREALESIVCDAVEGPDAFHAAGMTNLDVLHAIEKTARKALEGT